MLNRDIYAKEPAKNKIANNGVAELSEDVSAGAQNVLRYELQTFVCNGQYEKGLERILGSFLSNLDQEAEQPGVWISGFYGSGKSHLAKMLRVLWTDFRFADGATARSLVHLPNAIGDQLKELAQQAKRHGGLRAASGKLGAAASASVRLALQEIVFRAAGLPEKYHRGSFVLWLRDKGVLEKVRKEIEKAGDNFDDELRNMFVSPSLAKALLKSIPGLAEDEKEVRQLLKQQFKEASDLSNAELIEAIERAFKADGKFPLSLIVLDELQQYISDEGARAYNVQEVIETCSKHFCGKLLFVGTGQSALTGTTNLQKLLGRFPIQIGLSDTDVEGVIREVILKKKTGAVPHIDRVLSANSGEISRQLAGTRIEAVTADNDVLVADYPLLPVRRRLWERFLRAVDASGAQAQLRNQLRVVHEAAKATESEPLGHVVGGDFIYDQNAASLLQTAALPREIYENVLRLEAGTADETLKARILKAVYLVGKLPAEPGVDLGVRATAEVVSDLLVTDLPTGSAEMRKRVTALLGELLNKDGLVMAIDGDHGTEYRLQTKESSAWQTAFRQHEAELRGASARVANDRADRLRARFGEVMKAVVVKQGKTAELRSLAQSFDAGLPADHGKRVVVWVQDGWENDEKSVQAEAQRVGPSDPTVFVFVPARNQTELTNAIITAKAAQTTIESRGAPSSVEGQEALEAMKTRQSVAEKAIKTLLDEILRGARVWQGGGAEVNQGVELADNITAAGEAAVQRLYLKFDLADRAGWDKVYERAKKGDGQALEAVGYHGDADKHPVCVELLKFIGAGKKGSELRDAFRGPPYGWAQDVIDGAVYALLAAGHLTARDAHHKAVDAKTLERKNLTQASFRPETVTVTAKQLIAVRGLMQAVGVACVSNDEVAVKAPYLLSELRQVAARAGGDAPRPAVPDTAAIAELEKLAGNELVAALAGQATELKTSIDAWKAAEEAIGKRMLAWVQLQDLLDATTGLAPADAISAERDEVLSQRALLRNPDPVTPLIDRAVEVLRKALNYRAAEYARVFAEQKAALDADADWQKLLPADRDAIAADNGLAALPMPDTRSAQSILEALAARSLEQWHDRTIALPGRFQAARQEAVRRLKPNAVPVHLPHRTLTNAQEVKDWVAEVEKLLLEKIAKHPISM